MSLSASEILGQVDSKVDRVEVPEFGGEVCVAQFTAEQAERFRQALIGALDDGLPGNVRLVILGACDERGKRLFTDADADMLKTKNSMALTLIANKVLEFNGLTVTAEEEAKNASSETADGDSSSASPAISEEPSKS